MIARFALVLALAVGAVSCFESPAPMATVHVHVLSLDVAIRSDSGSNVDVSVYFRPRQFLALDAGPDAGIALDVRRVAAWTGEPGPFDFDVEIPEDQYGAVRAEAVATVRCGSNVRAQVLARGSAMPPEVTAALGQSHDVSIAMTAVASAPCP